MICIVPVDRDKISLLEISQQIVEVFGYDTCFEHKICDSLAVLNLISLCRKAHPLQVTITGLYFSDKIKCPMCNKFILTTFCFISHSGFTEWS